MSNKTLLAFMDGSLEMIPKPVQGASSKTLSKVLGKIYGYFLPSLHVTTVLLIPKRNKLNCKAFNLYFLRSFAKIAPVFFIN